MYVNSVYFLVSYPLPISGGKLGLVILGDPHGYNQFGSNFQRFMAGRKLEARPSAHVANVSKLSAHLTRMQTLTNHHQS